MSSTPAPRVQDPDTQGAATSPAVLAPSIRLQGALQTLMERLATRMEVFDAHERAFPSDQQHLLEALLDELSSEGVIGPDLDRRFLLQAAVSETVGLGPLDRVLTNRAVREVVVEGPSRILADLGGGLAPVSSFFSSPRAVFAVLQRLFGRGGRLLGSGPVEEAQLPDGSQVQVLLPPLSPSGPLLSIRCPVRAPISPDSLVTEGTLSIDMLALLRGAMHRRINVLVVGPMGSGVSTLVSAIGSLCHDHERILTLQDSPSLSIRHPNVLPLSMSGAGDRRLPQVLRHASKLRTDRIVIDDLRNEDSLAILSAAAASRGFLAGMHAATPAGALEQLELFAQITTGGSRTSLAALIAQAFGVLVHINTDPSGTRRVQSIAEIRGAHDSTVEVTALYRYDNGFKQTDHRPSFM
jgi:pilus assembly protein CpaF